MNIFWLTEQERQCYHTVTQLQTSCYPDFENLTQSTWKYAPSLCSRPTALNTANMLGKPLNPFLFLPSPGNGNKNTNLSNASE